MEVIARGYLSCRSSCRIKSLRVVVVVVEFVAVPYKFLRFGPKDLFWSVLLESFADLVAVCGFVEFGGFVERRIKSTSK